MQNMIQTWSPASKNITEYIKLGNDEEGCDKATKSEYIIFLET